MKRINLLLYKKQKAICKWFTTLDGFLKTNKRKINMRNKTLPCKGAWLLSLYINILYS